MDEKLFPIAITIIVSYFLMLFSIAFLNNYLGYNGKNIAGVAEALFIYALISGVLGFLSFQSLTNNRTFPLIVHVFFTVPFGIFLAPIAIIKLLFTVRV